MRLFPRFRRREPDPEREAMIERRRGLKDRGRRGRDPEDVPANPLMSRRSVSGPEAQPQDAEVYDEQLTDGDTPPDYLVKRDPSDEAAYEGESLETVLDEALDLEADVAAEKPADPNDPFGGDMMDVFRESKSEAADNSLAGQVEDVSIKELLSDLEGITMRLGVKRSKPIVHTVHIEPPAPVIEPEIEVEPEPEVRVEKVPPHAIAAEFDETLDMELDEEAFDEVLEEELVIESLIIEAHHPQDPPAEPELEMEPTPRTAARAARPVARPEPQPERRGPDGNLIMHVLFIGLVLSAAGVFGLNRVHQSGALASAEPAATQIEATPVVLAVYKAPEPRATLKPVGTKAPTASPSPTPSPMPTPAPTPPPTPKPPRVRDPNIPPAYRVYTVEYGDSLTSMAIDAGICPDHILWNNPDRDEDTPLYAGDELVIPDAPGVMHTVEEGDTLIYLALLYNSTTDAITGVRGNQVSSDEDLVPGERIFIPNGIPQSALEMSVTAQRKMTVESEYGYVWPFFGVITTYYGEQRPGYVHNAIDIGALGHYGMSVLAMADGTVVLAGSDSAYGNNVIVEHADGSRSRYAHLSQTYVRQGDVVNQGTPLGALGCSGDATGTHLHFELWRGGRPVDPLLYFS